MVRIDESTAERLQNLRQQDLPIIEEIIRLPNKDIFRYKDSIIDSDHQYYHLSVNAVANHLMNDYVNNTHTMLRETKEITAARKTEVPKKSSNILQGTRAGFCVSGEYMADTLAKELASEKEKKTRKRDANLPREAR